MKSTKNWKQHMLSLSVAEKDEKRNLKLVFFLDFEIWKVPVNVPNPITTLFFHIPKQHENHSETIILFFTLQFTQSPKEGLFHLVNKRLKLSSGINLFWT